MHSLRLLPLLAVLAAVAVEAKWQDVLFSGPATAQAPAATPAATPAQVGVRKPTTPITPAVVASRKVTTITTTTTTHDHEDAAEEEEEEKTGEDAEHEDAPARRPSAASVAPVSQPSGRGKPTVTITEEEHEMEEEEEETAAPATSSRRGSEPTTPSRRGSEPTTPSRRGSEPSARGKQTVTVTTSTASDDASEEEEDETHDDTAADIDQRTEVEAAEDAAAAERDPRPRDPEMMLVPHHTIEVNVATHRHATATTLGTDSNTFYAKERFALFNPHKRTCAFVKAKGLRKRPTLVTEPCSLHQQFIANSPFAFQWLPAGDNNLAHLAIQWKGETLCATRHRFFGSTRFAPCSAKSTKYSLGATQKRGTFKIRDAARSSRCLDAKFRSSMSMRPCGQFRDQGWEKIHIRYGN